MEAAIAVVLFVSLIVAALLVPILFAVQIVGYGVWRPMAFGVLCGIGVFAIGYVVSPHSPLWGVFAPLIAVALGRALLTPWSQVTTAPPLWVDRLSQKHNCLILLSGIATASLVVYLELGRPLLLRLGYDVLGHTFEESRDVAIAGSIIGFIIGGFAAAAVMASIIRRRHK